MRCVCVQCVCIEGAPSLCCVYILCTLCSRCKCVLSAEVDQRVEVEERPEVVEWAEADERVEVHAHGG